MARKRQELMLRTAAIAIQALGRGKHAIGEFVDALKECGAIVSDDESIREWERRKARDIIEKVRRFDNLTETGKVDYLPLHEYTEDGKRSDYWRLVDDCTVEEMAQHLSYWNREGRTCDRRFHYYYQIAKARFGAHKVQQLLKFNVPADPDVEEQAG
jgi:hypothetical protein